MQTLADTIIYGDVNDVAKLLEVTYEDINDIDEYGYNPLIEAVLMEKPDILKLLLQRGADVNAIDITEKTALHWAVDYGDAEITRYLLGHGANPNAYSRGGQPVLVFPLLRNDKAIKKILYQYGADVNFAKDYINTKLLGHRFQLRGFADIITHDNQFLDVDYEGFYFEFTLNAVYDSLNRFSTHFAARDLRHLGDHSREVIHAVKKAYELLRYDKHIKKYESHEHKVRKLLSREPLILPISHYGHAITLIKAGRVFAICDRGYNSREHGTANIYILQNPEVFTFDFIKTLLYDPIPMRFMDTDIFKMLKLKHITSLPLPPQLVGNCSWANIEAAVPTLMYILMEFKSNDPKLHAQQAMQYFYAWLKWDKLIALEECVQSFHSAKEDTRKAAKTGILAAVLFQTIHHDHLDELPAAEKIINILSIPKFQYILQSYIDVYVKDANDEQSINLKEILEHLGIYYS